MEFSRQEYWSGLPLPSLVVALELGKKNLGIACHYTDLKAEAQEADSLTPSPTEN